jgi:GT2 family glycosyltransferase
MDPEIAVLCVDGDASAEIKYYHDGQVESLTPEHPDAAREFARLTRKYESACLAWYDRRISPFLRDVTEWPQFISHPLEVLHLSCFQRCDLMVETLGLVDFESPFLLPGPTDRRYVTWLVSPAAGIGLASAFRAVGINPFREFAATLFDFGYRGARWGIFPYSEPRLLKEEIPANCDALAKPLSPESLATHIGRNYGRKWLPFWCLGCALHQQSLPLLSAIKAWFTSPAPPVNQDLLASLHPSATDELDQSISIDVVIPTLARPEHLLKVLEDLAVQTLLPRKVVVVEQNVREDEPTGIEAHEWPFELQYLRVAWVGVCRARNLGLRQVDADWVVLMDDDVRFSSELIAHLVQAARNYQVDAVNPTIHLPHQAPGDGETGRFPHIWPAFSTCVGLVSRRAVESTRTFDEQLEGGWGEDYEFGVRLRLNGANVIYAPGEPVLHLKADSGGFRQELFQPWLGEAVEPKPSPTVLYSRRKHVSEAMKSGYRNYYWLRRIAGTPVYRWLPEIVTMIRQWRRAVFWADRLASQGCAVNQVEATGGD